MQKMKSKKGFTLIEMLIVVGIIAVLVAVSIPMVNSSLDKAKNATDAANERAAKAAVMVDYLSNNTKIEKGMVYDAANGTIKPNASNVAGYGRCSAHKDGYLQVDSFNEKTGELKLIWAISGSGTVTPTLHELDTDSTPGAGTSGSSD